MLAYALAQLNAISPFAVTIVVVAGAAIFGITLYYHLVAMFTRRRNRARAQATGLLQKSRAEDAAAETAYSI
ncbi:MAG TPA: hypothetical protein VM008_14120 [Phycisphaerae bacterium]|nr:hypothetical protein [Phycisphaerae bacterium]